LPDQDVAAFVGCIRKCGKWIRDTQHPYKGTDQRIPPSALIKFWLPWQQYLAKTKPAAYTNGVHAPTEPALSLEEQRRRSAEAAKKYPPLVPGGGGR
jgi:hypothetical protein